MTDRSIAGQGGFDHVKPLTEGKSVKGGLNTTFRMTVRPPAPRPMRPSVAPTRAPAAPASPKG